MGEEGVGKKGSKGHSVLQVGQEPIQKGDDRSRGLTSLRVKNDLPKTRV